MTVDFTLDRFNLPTQINQARDWRVRTGKVKRQRQAFAIAWAVYGRRWFAQSHPPYRVKLVRIGPRHIDDDDVIMAFKHVRDELARQLGVNDGNRAHIKFEYDQERGPWAISVHVEDAIA